MLGGVRRGWRRGRVAGKGLTRPHAPARGGFSGSDAFEEVGDLLQALLLVWSVSEKDVAEKFTGNFAGKGCRRGGDPTAMRLSGVVREENEGTGVKHGHWTVRRN